MNRWLQVNEVTSSDTETTPQPKPAARKSISRELENLALDSPVAGGNTRSRRSTGRLGEQGRPVLKAKRRGRSIDGLGRDDSDAENIAEDMVPASKLAEVEKKCQDLTNQLKVGV